MTQLLGVHSNATPVLSLKYEAILQLLCATLYSLVQCEENCTSKDSNPTCSYDCCHTFIEVLSLGAGVSDTHPPVQYDRI